MQIATQRRRRGDAFVFSIFLRLTLTSSDYCVSSSDYRGYLTVFLKKMSTLNVHIKHAGKVYDLTLDTARPPLAFKEEIYQKTGVPMDRMKVGRVSSLFRAYGDCLYRHYNLIGYGERRDAQGSSVGLGHTRCMLTLKCRMMQIGKRLDLRRYVWSFLPLSCIAH